MPALVSIFLDFNLPNATTWFYFSFLLAMALFFKFSRLLSVRNLDVVMIFLLVPGLLIVQASRPQPTALEKEPAVLREAYGPHKFGQSVLLARRLIEAGTRLVQVNWPREGDQEVKGSPLWDTHANNAARVRDVLCPQFDRTFATLITDLHQRGLLDETLVVVMGEFGRSPKHNANGGRDHWGSVFSVALAGAGIGGGQIIGASDRLGALPESRPVRPADLAATVFHLLGINPAAEFLDPLQRPRSVTNGGVPLKELAG